MIRSITYSLVFSIQLYCAGIILAQGKSYDGPDDPAGDIAAERSGYLDGNNIYLYFQNTTEFSGWPLTDSHIWPQGTQGLRMTDGIALMIGARVYIENDSIPVTDWNEITSRSDLDTLYYLQTSYREQMDTDSTGLIDWGFFPVFGYFNEKGDIPAMSNQPDSWPPAGWPSVGDQLIWPGEWNGRFGRGIITSDLETYVVVNDAQDQEYLGTEDTVVYYPRPGVFIGDKRPEVTIQKGLPWGGIGIRIEQRTYQWNNTFAKDIIFWEYNIANISDYDLPEIFVGYWVDHAIGGDQDDEAGFYDKIFNLTYSWDTDGIGTGGKPTGTMGFAYLETPGMPFDCIDNDDDGLIDERRDNRAFEIVGPYDGISDLSKFLRFYNLKESDLREHWLEDEDQDWDDGYDTNGNGMYDYDEYTGDDIGIDGVGPNDLNYNGPDPDGTECNHRPDFTEGIGSEPDFGPSDVDESDMLGLTSFNMFTRPGYSDTDYWFKNDKSMWNLVGNNNFTEYAGQMSNLITACASGNFTLYQGRETHISMAMMHAFDPLAGLNASNHEAPVLFEQKHIAQSIYSNDYRSFAEPPITPTLSASMEDDNVILTWDNRSDRRTRESLLNNTNDFEGYKLYRATDPDFQEGVEWIYDEFENPVYREPIFQCDLIDSIQGFADFGLINGVAYYLGSETGLVHQYTDSTPGQNQTYYYALVAYDYGIESLDVTPLENSFFIEMNENDEIIRHSRNVSRVDYTGVGIRTGEQNPYSYKLNQNYPNPFNPSTTIRFTLPESEFVELKVFNVLGEEVSTLVSKKLNQGIHTYTFDGNNLISSIYYYRIEAGNFVQTRKMIYLK